MQTTSFHLRSTRFSLISIDGNNISDGEMILLGCQTDDQLSWDNDFIKKKKMIIEVPQRGIRIVTIKIFNRFVQTFGLLLIIYSFFKNHQNFQSTNQLGNYLDSLENFTCEP